MNRPGGLAWLALFVWSAWLFALQGYCASSSVLGTWTPEVGVILLLALTCRLSIADARFLAVLMALIRIAFSADPPLAILVGYVGVVEIAAALGAVIEVDDVLSRTLLSFALTLALSFYWFASASLTLEAEALPGLATYGVVASALATALAAAFLTPALARLPGLSPFWKERR